MVDISSDACIGYIVSGQDIQSYHCELHVVESLGIVGDICFAAMMLNNSNPISTVILISFYCISLGTSFATIEDEF